MMTLKRRFRYVFFACAGAVTGYLIFHPYTMFAHILVGIGKNGLEFDYIYSTFKTSLSFDMSLMAIAFTAFGAVLGLLIGVLTEWKRRLFEANLEMEKRKTAVETLQRVMITLSHHLLNANTVIGGTAFRCRRAATDDELIEALDIIRDQAAKIDTVINALKRITEIKTTDYTAEGKDLLIDISREIDESASDNTPGVKCT